MEKIKMMIKNFVAGSLWQLFVDCIVRDLVISSSFSWSLETLLPKMYKADPINLLSKAGQSQLPRSPS